jgi:NACalpha-BTF3-like transcription factor
VEVAGAFRAPLDPVGAFAAAAEAAPARAALGENFERDLALVVESTGCSRARAAAALVRQGGDLVEAIIDVTT